MGRDTQTEAVRTAGERLEAIEHWSRWTAITATVAASCLAVLVALAIYVGLDYVALKRGMREAQESFAREFNKAMPRVPQRPPAMPPAK